MIQTEFFKTHKNIILDINLFSIYITGENALKKIEMIKIVNEKGMMLNTRTEHGTKEESIFFT